MNSKVRFLAPELQPSYINGSASQGGFIRYKLYKGCLKINVCPWHVFHPKVKANHFLLIGDSPNFTVNETQISLQAKSWISQRSKGKFKLLCQWVPNHRMRRADRHSRTASTWEWSMTSQAAIRRTQILRLGSKYCKVSNVSKLITFF